MSASSAPSAYAPPIIYTKQVYSLTLFSIVALNLNKTDPAGGSFHRARLRELETQEPLLRHRFDIYWDGHNLIWIQNPCQRLDGRARFILHVFPVDDRDLPPDRRSWGFDNLTFTYANRGVRVDQACLVVAPPLPAWPIAALRVGQWIATEKRTLWQALVDFPLDPATAHDYRAAYRTLATRVPVQRAPFNVYAATSGITVAKSRCAAADIAPRFIVHVEPFDPRRASGPGFDNLDFALRARGRRSVRFDDKCLAFLRLPDYPIRQVTVAQRPADANEVLWQAVVTQPFAQTAVQAYRAAYAALTAGEPALRAAFDVYVTADEAAYAKAPCAAADTEPKFILHVLPVRPRDLPSDRRRAGFDNLDFEFAWQGAHFEGRCLARAALPEYPIDRLRVGQFRSGEAAPLWQSEIALDREPSAG